MTHTWKAGDLACVEIADIGRGDTVFIKGDFGVFGCPKVALHPLPDTVVWHDGEIAPEAQAVLDAAVKWDDTKVGTGGVAAAEDGLIRAIDAYRASQPKPDPVKELRGAFEAYLERSSLANRERVNAAIAAVRAALGGGE